VIGCRNAGSPGYGREEREGAAATGFRKLKHCDETHAEAGGKNWEDPDDGIQVAGTVMEQEPHVDFDPERRIEFRAVPSA
jgi:hypothetical protein